MSKCIGGQFDFKRSEKVTGEIDFDNFSNFTSKRSDSFPAADQNRSPEKKYDLQICDCSGQAGQRGPVMVENQHENLLWVNSLNSTP